MRGENQVEDSAPSPRSEGIKTNGHSPIISWRAVGLGVAATCVSFIALVAIGWLLVLAEVAPDVTQEHGGRTLVILVVLSLVIALAFGTWFSVRVAAPHGSILVGPIVAIVVLVGSIAVAWPFVSRMADFHSVAIALGLIDAPDVGTRTSAALDQFVTDQGEAGDSARGNAVSTAWQHVRATLWYLVAVVVALIAAAGIGAALGHRSTGSSEISTPTRVLETAGLAAIGSGIAILTIMIWPNIPPVYGALFDFDQSAGPEVGVSMSEVARHPEVMWGKTVTISARVDQSLSPHSLLLGNDKPVVGDKVLVVSESKLGDLVLLLAESDTVLEEGDVIQVTGVVREYEPAELEASLGVNLDKEALSGYSSPAVLVAEEIDVDVPIASAAGDQEFGGSAGYDLGVTISDVTAHPQEHAGLTVTVSGEVEEHLLTPHAFLLGDDALLAVTKTPRPELFVEATVYITGEVRLFNLKDTERELGIDLDDEALRSYEGQPVILVDSLLLMK